MKIKTLIRFNDELEGVIREVGDVFEVTSERLGEILSASTNPLVEELDEKTVDETEKITTNEIEVAGNIDLEDLPEDIENIKEEKVIKKNIKK